MVPSLRWLVVLFAVVAAHLAVAGCATPTYAYRQIVMGVETTLTIAAPDEATAKEAGRAAFARLAELEAVMSDYRSDSEVMRLCATHDEAVHVSLDLFRVLEEAALVREATDGDFDVTVGPLTKLWREARASGTLPSPEAVAEARSRVGGDKLVVDPEAQTVLLRAAGMRLDLGGIGKGFAAAAAVATLREHGCPQSLVAIAGDIAAGDAPPGRPAWLVKVEEPSGRSTIVRLVHASISTSGDREQWIEIDGVRHSHVLDPRTGLGATTQIQVSVLGPDGRVVDALSSALSIRSVEAGLRTLERFPGYAALFVERLPDGTPRVTKSPNWPPERPLDRRRHEGKRHRLG